MNTLKNVLFFGLLLAVLCGVYLSLNRTPESNLPKDLSGDTTPVKVEMGDLIKPPAANLPSGQGFGGIPSLPPQPPVTTQPPTRDNGMAPPFEQAKTAEQSSAAPPWPSGGSGALPPPPPTPPTVQQADIRELSTASNSSAPPPIGPSPAALPPPAEHLSSSNLDLIMQQVRLQVEKNRFPEALLNLSQLYGNPDLPASQARVVTTLLDQMAFRVIFSREHWLEAAYLVQAGDTLESIADRYQVPALLLARINGISDPRNLPPGKELKVLKGPFSAQISTDHSEMTMMLDGRYAVRFNVVLSNDLSHTTSLCTVRDKRAPTAAAGNGTGKQWIELGNASGTISMQGTNDTRATSGADSRNTIWLNEQDMDDVFGILSVGSRVIIQR